MTFNVITSDEIIFIHEIIEKNFGLPKGHIKVGDLETLLEKSNGVPFSENRYDLFMQASIIFEGIARLHIFTDGNKRTALEATRQFLSQNNHVFIIPLSGTNFIYNVARNETHDTDGLVSDISVWVKTHSAKISERYKIAGLLFLHLLLPLKLVNFFSKIKLNRISRWILYRYLENEDPKITELMFSIYEKQLGLFQLSAKGHEKQDKTP